MLESQKNIPLVDEQTEKEGILTEEGIKLFIKYVQHQPIHFTKETVHTLNYLSMKYVIPSLQLQTSKYIADHQKDLLIEIITFNTQNSTEDKGIYEDILSNNLLHYIEDERLFMLKITSIYLFIIKIRRQSQ